MSISKEIVEIKVKFPFGGKPLRFTGVDLDSANSALGDGLSNITLEEGGSIPPGTVVSTEKQTRILGIVAKRIHLDTKTL